MIINSPSADEEERKWKLFFKYNIVLLLLRPFQRQKVHKKTQHLKSWNIAMFSVFGKRISVNILTKCASSTVCPRKRTVQQSNKCHRIVLSWMNLKMKKKQLLEKSWPKSRLLSTKFSSTLQNYLVFCSVYTVKRSICLGGKGCKIRSRFMYSYALFLFRYKQSKSS